MSDWMDLLIPETRARFEAFLDGRPMPDFEMPAIKQCNHRGGPKPKFDWETLVFEVDDLVDSGTQVLPACRTVAAKYGCKPSSIQSKYYVILGGRS